MAIIDKNGNYLRANINGCYADPSGFHASILVHENKEARELEKNRERKFLELESKVNSLYLKYIGEVNGYILENNINFPEEAEKLPEEISEKLRVASELFNDLELVRRGIHSYGGEMPKNLELFFSLGLPKNWFESGVPSAATVRVLSSPYNRQRFDFETVYKEIKKTLKDGFKDC